MQYEHRVPEYRANHNRGGMKSPPCPWAAQAGSGPGPDCKNTKSAINS